MADTPAAPGAAAPGAPAKGAAGPDTAPEPAPGLLSRLRTRITSTKAEVEAAELRDDTRVRGATPIADAIPGQRTVVYGRLRSVTLRPRTGVPAIEAELYDGSGKLTLVWLGRRRIRGIEPGRVIVAEGRVNHRADRPMMFNPRYSLRPRAGE